MARHSRATHSPSSPTRTSEAIGRLEPRLPPARAPPPARTRRRAYGHCCTSGSPGRTPSPGRPNETERALAAAEAALAEVDGSPQPDWVTWVDHNELQIMTGRCWTELRRPLRAVPVLKTALAHFDNAQARDKSLYMSWLAASYLHAGEVEEAAAVMGHALDLSAEVASVRPRQRLDPILKTLTGHGSVPSVAAVLEKSRA